MAIRTTNDLDTCVRTIICGLSSATLSVLDQIFATYQAQIQLQILFLQSELSKLDILAAPVVLANEAAQSLLSQVRAAANLLPMSLIAGCTQFSDVNLAIRQNIDRISADAQVVATDLTRLLSMRDEVSALINELNTVLDLYAAIRAQISLCQAA